MHIFNIAVKWSNLFTAASINAELSSIQSSMEILSTAGPIVKALQATSLIVSLHKTVARTETWKEPHHIRAIIGGWDAVSSWTTSIADQDTQRRWTQFMIMTSCYSAWSWLQSLCERYTDHTRVRHALTDPNDWMARLSHILAKAYDERKQYIWLTPSEYLPVLSSEPTQVKLTKSRFILERSSQSYRQRLYDTLVQITREWLNFPDGPSCSQAPTLLAL